MAVPTHKYGTANIGAIRDAAIRCGVGTSERPPSDHAIWQYVRKHDDVSRTTFYRIMRDGNVASTRVTSVFANALHMPARALFYLEQ